MRILDIIYLILLQSFRAPLRSVVTIFSFCLGVITPVFVFGISEGMEEQIREILQADYRRTIVIYPDRSGDTVFVPMLRDVDLVQKSNLPVELAAAFESWPNKFVMFSGRSWRVLVEGVSPQAFDAMSSEFILGSGAIFSQPPGGIQSCVINERLFNAISAGHIPFEIHVDNLRCLVVGVIAGGYFNVDSIGVVYLEINNARDAFRNKEEMTRSGRRIFQSNYQDDAVSRILVRFQDYHSAKNNMDKIINIVNNFRVEIFQFSDHSNMQFNETGISEMENTKNRVDLFITVVMIIIYVFIIFNVSINSLYSIRARSEEISLSMALGASGRALLILVLLEIYFFAGLGSALGVVGAYLVASPFSDFADFRVVVNAEVIARSIAMIFLASTISIAVPAWFASKVDPAIALKG